MRKHVLFLTVAVFLSTVAFITCKKNDTKDQPENNENKEIIAKVTSWIERQKSTTLPKNHTKLDSLMNNLNFSELRFEQLNQKEQFIVIPIKKEFVTINNKDKAPINTLLLVLNDSGNIA